MEGIKLVTADKAAGSVELTEEIIDGGEHIKVLHFRKPKVRDIETIEKAAQNGSAAGFLSVVCLLSGITNQAAKDMDGGDIVKIRKEMERFFTVETNQAIEEALKEGQAVSIATSVSSGLTTGRSV